MNRFPAPKSGQCRRLLGVSSVGAAVAVIALAGAPAAFAAEDYIQFSLDGKTYAPSISVPIFKDAISYVPGDQTGSTLWVRNTSGEPARLSSAAIMVRSDPQLNRQLGLTGGAASDLGDTVLLGSQGSCTDIPGVWDLGAGEDLELNLIIGLSMEAPNDTMNRSADFDMLFLLESKEAQQRTACEAFANPGLLPPGLEAAPGMSPAPAKTDPAAELAFRIGTRNSGPVMSSGPGQRGTATERVPATLPPQGTAPLEPQPPVGITPAGFQSTVEPVIRSLSGTLLIAASVLFAAAVVVRVREGRYE